MTFVFDFQFVPISLFRLLATVVQPSRNILRSIISNFEVMGNNLQQQ